MKIQFERFLYRAWLLENGEVVRCSCDTHYGDGDIQWEVYDRRVENERFATSVISREHARILLNQPHKVCGWYGELSE
jgi:hypothetical protein